jgi:ABC-2 type transport system ATP-binding protein
MTVLDVIVFFGALRGMRESLARAQAVRWLERLGLADRQRSRIETLSKGMQQKVHFVTTVIHDPELLILDEPASGLDPVNQDVLRDTIVGARREGRTGVLSTHNMDQADQVCDFVCIIARGRKVLDGPLTEIRRGHAGHRYRVVFEDATPAARALMEAMVARGGGAGGGDAWELDLPSAEAVSAALAALAAADAPVATFERIRPSLHQIFVDQVGHAATGSREAGVGRA